MKVRIKRHVLFGKYSNTLRLLKEDCKRNLDTVELFIDNEDINFEEELEKFTNNDTCYTDKKSLDNLYNVIYILKVFYSNGVVYVNDNIYDRAMTKFKKYRTEPIVEHISVVDKRLTDTKHDYPTLKGTLSKCNKIYLKDEEDSMDLSLERIIAPWFDICVTHCEQMILSLTRKFDGTSIILSLSPKGNIKRAISRGDEDDKGIDVTHLFKHLKFKNDFKCGLKTECVMTQTNLDEYSKIKNYNYKNLRVAPVSILTSIDSVRYSKYLTLVPLKCSEPISNSELNELFSKEVINEEHLVSNYSKFSDILSEISDYIDDVLRTRSQLNYAIDGIVISCLNKCVIDKMGRKNNINKFEVAYKFPPIVRYSKCTGFDFTVGRTGLITPMVYYEPVEFFGGIHDKSTLSSYERFSKLDLSYGDTLKITYNNDVMPYVRKYEDNNGKKIEFPKICKCGEELTLVGANYYCKNPYCIMKNINILSYFFKKLGVVGFSEKTMVKLKDTGMINDIKDLFTLDYNELMKLDGFGVKKVENLKSEIDKLMKRKIDEAKLISALSISGEKTARAILSKIPLFDIINSPDSIYSVKINGIGDKIKETFISRILQYKSIIDDLHSLLHIDIVKEKNSILKITFSGFRDKKIQEILEVYGIEIGSSTTKNTNYVVVKDNNYEPSSKISKANDYGIPIVTLQEFMTILKDDLILDII